MHRWLILGIGLLTFLLIFFLLPDHFQVERSIQIQMAQEEVYDDLVNLESWKEWSPWLEKEPSASYEFHGIPGVVGSYAQWKGQEIGAGKQTLIKLAEPQLIETQLEFYEPQPSKAIGYMKLEAKGDSVKVTWGLRGELGGVQGRIFGLFIPSLTAPDFEKGLKNLKSRLESQSY